MVRIKSMSEGGGWVARINDVVLEWDGVVEDLEIFDEVRKAGVIMTSGGRRLGEEFMQGLLGVVVVAGVIEEITESGEGGNGGSGTRVMNLSPGTLIFYVKE